MLFSPSLLLKLSAALSSSLAGLFLTALFSSLPLSAATLTVAAAADLASVQQSLSTAFHQKTGADLRFSLGSSGVLAKQIENGAPFDVFVSANEKYVKDLAASGHVDPASVHVYALGRLGLWSFNGNIHDLNQLLSPEVKRIAIANPQFAPYGAAAKDLLERAGLWTRLKAKIVYGENVSQTLQYADSQNADAAIVSWTLVASKGGTLLPANHAPIRQAVGIVAATKQSALALQFVNFLLGPEGRAVLSAHGLTPP